MTIQKGGSSKSSDHVECFLRVKTIRGSDRTGMWADWHHEEIKVTPQGNQTEKEHE